LTSAFVEIVFDNGEGRFPTGKDETTIRRTVSLNRDEFQLDGKVVPKSDIDNLLQAAGFSKSNPYYIVPQGRITALCNAQDSQRLNLLKEVAGTKVYEEHRAESAKILEETRLKREKIAELLGFIEERLSELEMEKSELSEYELIDKKRRAMEMIIFQRELKDINSTLESLSTPEDGEAETQELVNRIQTIEEQLMINSSTLTNLNEQNLIIKEESLEFKQDKLEANHAIQNNKVINKNISKLESDLSELEQKIIDKEDSIGGLFPKKNNIERQVIDVQGELSSLKVQQDSLKAKQQRSGQFKNGSERDKYLKSQVESLTEQLDQKEQQVITLEEELKGTELREGDLQDELQAFTKQKVADANEQHSRNLKRNSLLELQRYLKD
jgi:structural maintenance of chromosome 3 (chondroitin sulfate proteoglycan 6)